MEEGRAKEPDAVKMSWSDQLSRYVFFVFGLGSLLISVPAYLYEGKRWMASASFLNACVMFALFWFLGFFHKVIKQQIADLKAAEEDDDDDDEADNWKKTP
jgi:hypothetical protein